MEITFKHSGFMGDIIYALPAIKRICEDLKGKAVLYVFLDKTWENFEDVGRAHKGLMTAKQLNFIAPLLKTQDYIADVRPWKGERIAVDLDRVKAMGQQIGLPHSHISRWYGYAFPELSTDSLHMPAIDIMDVLQHCVVEGLPNDYTHLSDTIVVNRTKRNINPYVNYVFLKDYPVLFVGDLCEYEDFREQVPTAEFKNTTDAIDLALTIFYSRMFIGNQSMCYSIAENLKTPRLLEAYSGATNVVPTGSNGHDFYTQEGLECLTRKIYSNGETKNKLQSGETDLH
jgi:hypothetical protein